MPQVNSKPGGTAKGILVTGASRGIGLACALALSANGWSVVGTCRDPGRYTELEGGLPIQDLPFSLIQMDVCDDGSVSTAVARAVELTGGLTGVVANAGCAIYGPLEDVPMKWARIQYDTNLLGVVRVLREVIPHLRAKGNGTIVVMGSLASRIHLPFQSHYTATKAALVGLCSSVRMELRPYKIGVHLVEPTDIRTTITDNRMKFIRGGSPYETRCRRCLHVVERAERNAQDPQVVADAVLKIFQGRCKGSRVPVGKGSLLNAILRAVLPTRLAECLIRFHFKA